MLVAIVSTNDVRYVPDCLQSLIASTHRNFRVVICENGGLEAFERLANTLAGRIPEIQPNRDEASLIKWPHGRRDFVLSPAGQCITVLNAGKNLGYAGGVNACIAAANQEKWDAVWVLNPDTFPDPDALAALVRHQKWGDYGIVGSRLLYASTGLVQTWGGIKYRSFLGRGRLIGLNKPGDTVPDTAEVERSIGFISGASMYVSRAYVDAVGVMDDDFFVYFEDVDWCLRRGPFKLGYAHDFNSSPYWRWNIGGYSSGSRITVYLDARNRILLARKRFASRWPIFAAVSLVYVLERLLRSMSARQFRFALDGWWAGVRGERGAPEFVTRLSAS